MYIHLCATVYLFIDEEAVPCPLAGLFTFCLVEVPPIFSPGCIKTPWGDAPNFGATLAMWQSYLKSAYVGIGYCISSASDLDVDSDLSHDDSQAILYKLKDSK